MKNDEIEHAGIKGMKWREHKEGAYDPKASAKIRERQMNQLSQLRRKRISEMTKEEVSKMKELMDLKKKYKGLSSAKVNKGKKVVKNIMSVLSNVKRNADSASALSEIGSSYYKRVNAPD